MAHMIDHSTGKAAYGFSAAEGAGWHGLGRPIPADIAKDPAKIAAFVNAAYKVAKAPSLFRTPDGELREYEGRFTLYRDDTFAPLGHFSEGWKEVQPVEYFEAFRDALAKNHLTISSAAVLQGGATVFVNARLDDAYALNVMGIDKTMHYLCLGGGYDGKRSSFGFVSGLRTVCWNTLSANLTSEGVLRVPHSQVWDGKTVAAALGLFGTELRARGEAFNTLAGYKLHKDKVAAFFAEVLGHDPATIDARDDKGKDVMHARTKARLEALAEAYRNGPGADLKTAKNTLYGALNAVTYWVDHVRKVKDTDGSGEQAARVANVQLGSGADIKRRALILAMAKAGIGEKVLQAA